MINIYFSYKNQASIPIMALFLISVLGFVAFLYTAPRETLCLTDYSALIYCYFPSDLLSFSTYLLSLNWMGYQVWVKPWVSCRDMLLIFLLHQLCN